MYDEDDDQFPPNPYDWIGNRTEPGGRYLTDGHLLVDATALVDAAGMARFRHQAPEGRRATPDDCERVIALHGGNPRVAVEPGVLHQGALWDYLELRRVDGKTAWCNACKWVLARASLGFDSAEQMKRTTLGAVLLLRSHRIVGLLMPVKYEPGEDGSEPVQLWPVTTIANPLASMTETPPETT